MLSNHPNCLGGNGPSASSDLIGDVDGPASATDNAVARFDGTTGKLIQNSVVTIADTTGAIAGASSLTSPAATNLTLAAGGTNQNVVLTPSGTGGVGIGTTTTGFYTSGYKYLSMSQSTGNGYAIIELVGGAGGGGEVDFGNQTVRHGGIYSLDGSHLVFATNNGNTGTALSERMRIASTGTVSIASSTAGSAGAGALVVTGGLATGAASYLGGGLTFAAATTSAGGITFGSDLNLFRSSAGVFRISSTSNYSTEIINTSGTGAASVVFTNGGSFYVGSDNSSGGALGGGTAYAGVIATGTAVPLIFRTNSTTALTISTAQAATFAGAVAIANTVSSVSPTSPNRTITMVVGGVTLYIAAKTTND